MRVRSEFPSAAQTGSGGWIGGAAALRVRPRVEPERGLLFFWQLGWRDQLTLDSLERVTSLKASGDRRLQLPHTIRLAGCLCVWSGARRRWGRNVSNHEEDLPVRSR